MIVVDTSVWVSAHQSEDAHFSESSPWYEFWTIRELELHFPLLVIPEIAGVLSRKGIPPADAAKSIGNIVGSRTIALHELDLTNALLAARVSANNANPGNLSGKQAALSCTGVPSSRRTLLVPITDFSFLRFRLRRTNHSIAGWKA